MGKVALGSHFQSCLRKREGLEKQSEYEVAASEARTKEMQGQLARMENSVEQLKNASSQNRASLQEQKDKLAGEVKALEGNVSDARREYDIQYTEWYDTKGEVAHRLEAVQSCHCEEKSSGAVSLRQAAATGASVLPDDSDRDYMYDTAQKVEDCEAAVITLGDKIAAAQKRARVATAEGVGRMSTLKRRAADQQRLGNLLSLKPQVEALQKTKAALEDTLESWKGKYQSYKASTDELRASLDELDSKLSACGCAGGGR